jgi:hypothetical protein
MTPPDTVHDVSANRTHSVDRVTCPSQKGTDRRRKQLMIDMQL